MNSLGEKLIKIASAICEKYGDIKGNSVCQDFDVAEINLLSFFDEMERKQIMYIYEEMNSCGADYTEDSHKQMADGMVCGYAISEALNSDLMNNKIKLTKKPPTEEGLYYWRRSTHFDLNIVSVEIYNQHLVVFLDGNCMGASCYLEGYWAKVDQSMFEVVDDD